MGAALDVYTVGELVCKVGVLSLSGVGVVE